jgi:hypothetical protein
MLSRAGFPGAVGRAGRKLIATLGGYDFTGASLNGATLTRATVGSSFNSSGVLVGNAIDVARFDYDPTTLALRGLLIEEARTNAFVRSDEFDNAIWAKTAATVTANAAVAPDGTMTADKFFEDATNTQHRLQQPINVVSGTTYTFTVFVKAAERSWLGLAFSQLSGGNVSSFNVSNGTLGTVQATHTVDMTDAGGGWYRLRLTITANATAAGAFRLHLMPADNTFSYAGVGTNGILIWRAQHETGANATSAISTTTAAVARSADVLALVAPSGTATARYTFDDNSTQDVATAAGAYNAPTNLNRLRLRRVTYL